MHELASLFKHSLCNEVILTNLGRKQNNPLNCWAITFYTLSRKNAEPHPFLIASWVLLSQCFGFYFAESWTEDKKHTRLSESYAFSESSTKKASCHFQSSTQVLGIKSKTIKNQPQRNTITWPTAAVTHILSPCQLALLLWSRCRHPGVLPLPGREEGLPLERNFWKGVFGLVLPSPHSLEHCVPRTTEEHEGGTGSGWCTRRSRGCSTEPGTGSPLCLQSFPYPQKHERGAVTDTKPCTKPCTKHRGGAPV